MLFHLAVCLTICADPGMAGAVLIEPGGTPAMVRFHPPISITAYTAFCHSIHLLTVLSDG